jgi:NAD(P)-dependent dehydrogenase (short-subunit alcohol dehydrogenase family)
MPAEQVGSFGAKTLIGRTGQPAELASVHVSPASQESSYITGERVGVTGGCRCPDLRGRRPQW